MGAISNSFETVNARHNRVDFRAVSDAALMSLDMIANHDLPGGYRKGYSPKFTARRNGRLP